MTRLTRAGSQLTGEISLSIIIPTIGRPSLLNLLRQAREQLSEVDEIIVIGDGPVGMGGLVRGVGAQMRYLEHGPDHAWGHPQRNYAMPFARGSHLMFVDDDDRLCPEALRSIRMAIQDAPYAPLMFRMYHQRTSLWRKPLLADGNVATQMIVTPNDPGRLGTWGRRYAGDYDFILGTIALYPPGALVWRPELITIHGVNGRLPE